MRKGNALESVHLNLTLSDKWYGELALIASRTGVTIQDLIRDWIGEKLGLLPGK